MVECATTRVNSSPSADTCSVRYLLLQSRLAVSCRHTLVLVLLDRPDDVMRRCIADVAAAGGGGGAVHGVLALMLQSCSDLFVSTDGFYCSAQRSNYRSVEHHHIAPQ